MSSSLSDTIFAPTTERGRPWSLVESDEAPGICYPSPEEKAAAMRQGILEEPVEESHEFLMSLPGSFCVNWEVRFLEGNLAGDGGGPLPVGGVVVPPPLPTFVHPALVECWCGKIRQHLTSPPAPSVDDKAWGNNCVLECDF
jgi:hypothetical protein